MSKKLKTILALVAFCFVYAFANKKMADTNNSNMMVAVTYAMAESGESSEFCAGIGAWGTVVTSVGAGALGGPAGIATGLLSGL